MGQGSSYSVAIDEHDVIVRLRRDGFDRESVSRFLDYLELESIRRRSALTDRQAAALADEVDREVWTRLKGDFTSG